MPPYDPRFRDNNTVAIRLYLRISPTELGCVRVYYFRTRLYSQMEDLPPQFYVDVEGQ